jgi:hypothetical protein
MRKITQHTANGTDWLIVEVPIEATDIAVTSLGIEYLYQNGMNYIQIPDGNWQIHCIAEGASGEQAIEIVEGIREQGYITRYRNYMGSGYYASVRLSLESLITHHFGQNNYKHVILKKI